MYTQKTQKQWRILKNRSIRLIEDMVANEIRMN